jgi:carbon-monoxide dehydrogenase iron sulfur subunit
MKQVVVHPERCVGCMQCQVACAVAHSAAETLVPALFESPRPRPRIHVGAGRCDEGFPNRCRHCDPAPCLLACLPGAITRVAETATVMINADTCINCASCAMACPFGVIRYHEDRSAPVGKTVAVKCDNCLARQRTGRIPACVEACLSGALTFETPDAAYKRQTDAVARSVSAVAAAEAQAPGWALLNAHKQARRELQIAPTPSDD